MKLTDYPVVNGVTISQPDKNLFLKLDANPKRLDF